MGFLTRICKATCAGMALHLRRYALVWVATFVCLAAALGGLYLLVAPPANFPQGSIIVVAEGASAQAVARELADALIVTHPTLLRLLWRATGTGGSIPSGAYRFATPQNLLTIAWRLAEGDYGIPSTRITFIEGTTVREMATKIAGALPEISAEDFISVAQPYEGYLFPDTYSFPPSASAASVVKKLRDTFVAKTASLLGDTTASGHSWSDIVIMASIVEREARSSEARQMVAGILWNRIARGMPLQVDAVFGYIYGRATYSPSLADLQIDSPYNTYKYPGLPAGPICNPGLDSIEAALHPTKTNYLYYLTGRDGLMHYATTYTGHKANLKAYLN